MNLQLTEWSAGLELTVMLLLISIGMLLLLVWVVVLSGKLNRLRKRMAKIIGNAAAENVDDLLLRIQMALERQQEADERHERELNGIRREMKKMKCRVGIIRYNAFAQQGSDLSFSIAILDDEMDGVVLTGIHSREESYMYAKPVEKGQSKYTLSPEEKQVIDQTASSAKRDS